MFLLWLGVFTLAVARASPIDNNLCLNIDNVEGSVKQVLQLLEKKKLQVNNDEIKLMELEQDMAIYKDLFEQLNSSFQKYKNGENVKVKRDLATETLTFSEKMSHLIKALGILPRPHTTNILAELKKSNNGNKLYALASEMSSKLCQSVIQLKKLYKCPESTSGPCRPKVNNKKPKKNRLKPRANKLDQASEIQGNIKINGAKENGSKSTSAMKGKAKNNDINKTSLEK